MNRGNYRTMGQPRPDEEVESSPAVSSLVGQLIWLAIVLGIAALGLRALAYRAELVGMVANPAVLKAAMAVIAGTPVSTVAAADMLVDRVPPSGFQTRALSLIARSAGQTTTAEAWLKQGLADPSAAYLAQFELCRLYWNEGRRAHAREACRGTMTSALYWLSNGYVADQNGDRAEALAAFQMASSIDPDLNAAWHQLGHALFLSGRFDEAILAYERLMALEGTPAADVYQSLSSAYLEVDNPEMARDVLNRGLMLYPTERGYYMGMAETYRQEGDLETAESWYVRMLQRWPDDDQAWARRGEIAVASGRLEDAEEYYQEAARIQPEDAGYWLSLALAAAATDNSSLAVEAYRKAMALRPDDGALWLESGRYLARVGQVEAARRAFEHVLELEPGNREVMIELVGLNGVQ